MTTRKITIQEMQLLAELKGGICLSSEYINTDTKLKWKCSNGHEWEATPNHIKRGQWCRVCSGYEKKDIEYARQIAIKNGGECISTDYKNIHSKLKWSCLKGHVWEATLNNVKNGNWCPTCKGKNRTIDFFRELAINRGGLCLSTKYFDSWTKLKWKCAFGHTWMAQPNSILSGTWCPECNINYGEEICRLAFEHIFSNKFPKKRPDFLKYNNVNLELDGYCEDLKIAFEHQGKQHYQRSEKFHKEDDSLEKQLKRDEHKLKVCSELGIRLFVIPQIPELLKLSDFPSEINKQASNLGIKIPKTINLENLIEFIGYDSLYFNRNDYDELLNLAKIKNGALLSKSYLGDNIKLKWSCKNGHEWQATPNNIKNGTWCPMCYGNVKYSIKEIKDFAKSKNGECLSDVYLNNKQKLTWRCENNHSWEATFHKIKMGTWCPLCARVENGKKKIKYSYSDISDIIKSKGGELLSSNIEYINTQSIIKIACSYGHIWETKTINTIHGRWCPKCGRKKNGT